MVFDEAHLRSFLNQSFLYVKNCFEDGVKLSGDYRIAEAFQPVRPVWNFAGHAGDIWWFFWPSASIDRFPDLPVSCFPCSQWYFVWHLAHRVIMFS